MSKIPGVSANIGVVLWVAAAAVAQPREPGAGREAVAGRTGGRATVAYVPKPLLTASVDPQQFGTQDYTITTISAVGFGAYYVSPNLSAYCPPDVCTGGDHWYAALDLPAGTVIDYIGVNTATTVDSAMGFTLHFRDHLGGRAELASFSFPAHDFATDIIGPLGILIPANIDRAFVLDVELAPGLADYQFFGYVEIWWRRVVSDAPATPTFGDVPGAHPFYQFIEALAKSGISGGCGSGNFCPESPLTRGQMAAFLSKALGLHWSQ